MLVGQGWFEPVTEEVQAFGEGQVEHAAADAGCGQDHERSGHRPRRLVGMVAGPVGHGIGQMDGGLAGVEWHTGRRHRPRPLGVASRVESETGGGDRLGRFVEGHRCWVVLGGFVAGEGRRRQGLLRGCEVIGGRRHIGVPRRRDLVEIGVGVAIAAVEGHEDLPAHVERSE